jgi:hypothetical protein
MNINHRFIGACLLISFLCLAPSASWAEEASLTYTITNQGQPMPKAWFAVYKPGERNSYIRYANSGKPLKVEAGTYDIGIHFEEDAVKIVKWIENKGISGTEQESFDLGVPMTELCYTITNGGTDLGNKGWYAIHASKEDGYLHYGYSGKCFLAPSGTYQIALHHEEDKVKTIKWLDDEKVEGAKVQKTVELGQPVCQPRYTITNNGQDLGHKAWWGVYDVGKHDSYIAYKYSGERMTINAGTYDIGIEYSDGALKKKKWLENETLEGSQDKTVELGEAVTQAKVTITNGGVDVGRNAWWGVYKPGDHSNYLAYKYSGEPMTIGAGNYDIGIDFTDGDAHEKRWLDNQVFGNDYKNTVELGIPLASIKINVTNNGVDVGRKAWWGLYDKGERSNYTAYKHNGESMTIAEGSYDLGVHFEDGAVRLIRWVPDFEAQGKVEKTIELSAGMADLTVRVARKGQPLEKAWCGAYKTKTRGSYEAYAYSEKPMRVLHGTYDVGCFYSEAGISSEKWLEQQEVKADTRLEVELDLQPATLTIRSKSPQSGAAGNASNAQGVTASGDINISLILDASGSMAAKVEEQKTRLDVAKEVLSDVIDRLPKNVRVELQVYGTAPKAKVDCQDTKVLAPLGPVNAAALKNAIAALNPSGYTPIAYSLERAAASLPKGRNNSLILVTDGIESCNGDPCAVASRLSAEGLVTRSFVVGFGLDLDKSKFLSCVGKYYPASDRRALQEALKEAVSESLKPMTGHVVVYRPGDRKEIVVQGSLDEPLTVASGIYDVVIQTGDKSYTWAKAKIEGKMEKPLSEVSGVK